jgi:hypothetical protein
MLAALPRSWVRACLDAPATHGVEREFQEILYDSHH